MLIAQNRSSTRAAAPSGKSSQRRRDAFRQWLQRHRRSAKELELPHILERYGETISLSAAYRVAVSLGLRGKRLNSTRYSPFWDAINWRLPDSVLSAVWEVTRGNIRQGRLRLGHGNALYHAGSDRRKPQFQKEVAREQSQERTFKGARPR